GTRTSPSAPNVNGITTVPPSLSAHFPSTTLFRASSTIETISITVNAVNDAPSFDLPASPDQTVLEDAGAQTVSGFATNISKGPANETAHTLTFHTSNDNNALFSSQPHIYASTVNL